MMNWEGQYPTPPTFQCQFWIYNVVGQRLLLLLLLLITIIFCFGDSVRVVQNVIQTQKWELTINSSVAVQEIVKWCNVTDTISWRGHHDRVMQLNWLYFYAICQMMPLKVWPNKALGCNHQSICMPQLQPLCSAALVPNVLPRRDEGSGKPCAVIEAL